MGDFWYDTSSDILYVRINDGSNPLWLDISSIPGSSTYATLSGISSGTGYVGSVGYTGSASIIPGYVGSVGYTGSASIIPGYVGSVGYTGSASTIQGATGYVGSSGYAGTIALGYSYIGSAGTRARITNSGTASAAIFDFILPLGYTGSASTIQGAIGYVGSVGYTGSALPAVVQQKTSGTYPIAISDNQSIIEANGGVTITLGVLTTSVKIEIIQITTGVLTISPGAGATIYSRVANGTVYLSAQYAGCTVYNNSGGTLANWVVVGDISAT